MEPAEDSRDFAAAVRAALHALIADLSDETTATLLAVVRAWLTGPREPGGC